jgi:hypothetical protein
LASVSIRNALAAKVRGQEMGVVAQGCFCDTNMQEPLTNSGGGFANIVQGRFYNPLSRSNKFHLHIFSAKFNAGQIFNNLFCRFYRVYTLMFSNYAEFTSIFC